MQTTSEEQFNEENLAQKVEKRVVEYIEEREALHGYPWLYTYKELTEMFIYPLIAFAIFKNHGWKVKEIQEEKSGQLKYEIRVPDAPKKEEKSDKKE